MKKIIMLSAMVFALTTSFAFKVEQPIDKRVLNAFKIKFEGATDVSWTVGSSYYQAIFTLHGETLNAFYGLDSGFIGVIRYISSTTLPLRLQRNLKKMMGDYWIADLFELANDDGTTYYVTLEKADSKIVLESIPNANWSLFKKEKGE